jgi:hypothetical protein
MSERVEKLDVDVVWEPNAPEAYLLIGDFGDVVLALNAHDNDPDDRCVVLSWSGSYSASMGSPNDEARQGHRLYDKGLEELRWVGVVRESELIGDLEQRNRVHDRHDPARFTSLTHYIIPLKESLVEVVALDLVIGRIEGSTRQAALASAAR